MVTRVREALATATAAVLALTDLRSTGPHRYSTATLRERVVSVGNMHRLCIGYTWLDLMPLVPLPLSVPHKQTQHGHDDEKEKDDAHDSPCGLALRASCWTDLRVWVQLLHHQSCLIATDAFIARAAVACSSHIVTGSIVLALTQLLATISKCTRGTLLLAARPNEACSASTLARYVVAVCTVLAATDFGAVPAVEP